MPYAAGTLRAAASNQGAVVASEELRTAGRPAAIVLACDHATIAPSYDSVATVEATIVDANGVVVPDAADLLSFTVAGPGIIAAVDSGDHRSHEPFRSTQRAAYQGRCVAFVRASASSGQITLSATAPGLAAARVDIATSAP